MKVLFLHGDRQFAEVFSQRCSPLRRCAELKGVDFVFAEAPHVRDLEEGQDVPTRTWWREEDDGTYQGLEESVAYLKALWTSQGPFAGVLGFSQGAAAAILLAHLGQCPHHHHFASLRFVVAAAGVLPDLPTNCPCPTQCGCPPRPCVPVPALLLAGDADTLVPPVETVALSSRWFGGQAEVVRHHRGHVVPMGQAERPAIAAFMARMLAAPAAEAEEGVSEEMAEAEEGVSEEMAEAVAEEMEALRAIYEEELVRAPGDAPPFAFCVRLAVPPGLTDVENRLHVAFTLPPRYPLTPPVVRLEYDFDLRSLPGFLEPLERGLVAAVAEAATDLVGDAMCYQLVTAANEWLADHLPALVAEFGSSTKARASRSTVSAKEEERDAEPVEEEDEAVVLLRQSTAAAEKAAAAAVVVGSSAATSEEASFASGGLWEFTVGLVGKPSAGKSTFYNAATQPAKAEAAARVAAHPFTTIDPNVGSGFVGVPCPCGPMGLRETCRPAFGHAYGGQRRLKVVVKDVAGLVPGAYQGRGKGNRFLDDLCDADVLVHVVDASGTTDKDGSALEGEKGDPSEDVAWVRAELHQWIFGNVSRKWESIRRRPEKLLDMFSGYRSPRRIVRHALRQAGWDPNDLTSVSQWSQEDLHTLVATFLQVRFPILLALNKVDIDSASEHIGAIAAKFPHEATQAVSAKSECELQDLRRAGVIEYEDGGCDFTVVKPPAEDDVLLQRRLEGLRALLARYGGTGVLAAMSRAVALRAPVEVYPVADLGTCKSLPPAVAEGVAPPARGDSGVLRHCVLMKPSSTVEDAYFALKRPPVSLIRGDYVRAEGMGVDRKKKVVRKEDPLGTGTTILRVMTNKKASWQTGAPPPAQPAAAHKGRK